MMTDTPPINEADETTPVISATDPNLLQLLVCPRTKGPLIWDKAASELISTQAALAFQVRDGVPILSVAHARPLSEGEMKKCRRP